MSPTEDLQTMLLTLWHANRATIDGRVAVIRVAQARMTAGTMDDSVRIEARDAAHKLSGILGTFGLPHGSVVAHQAEAILDNASPAGQEDAPRLKSLLDELSALIAAKSQELS